MKFSIMGEYWAHQFQPSIPTIVISITDPTSKHPEYPENNLLLDVLKIHFDDIEDKFSTLTVFNENHAKEILEFVNKYKDKTERIVCQCQAGISRSSATAAALSIILDGHGSDNWIFSDRRYIPNMKVYRTLLKVGGFDNGETEQLPENTLSVHKENVQGKLRRFQKTWKQTSDKKFTSNVSNTRS